MLANAGREVTRGNRANRYDSVRGRSRRRTRRRLAHCTCGVLSCRDWQNGLSREAPELRSGKPGLRPGLLFEAERRISMIKLLVELPLIGRFTIIIVWHRKGQAVMAERDRGRLPGPATSILENAVRFKPHFVLPRTTPQAAAVPGLTGTKRNRHWLAQCTYGGLFLWRLEERVLKRSTGASTGKARFLAGPSSRSGKEDQLHDQIAS